MRVRTYIKYKVIFSNFKAVIRLRRLQTFDIL